MGVFATAQPEYAAHGIATFPVRADKWPATKGYPRVGLPGSRTLAERMPDAPCVGFLAGPRSKITVLDVDTPDERTFADALDMYGQTPVIIRTGSGNWHAWYRHNGEGRSIRPDPGRPIDILGDGVVIAPPSQARKGPYSFLQGSLADLASLPRMKGLEARPGPSNRLREGEGRNAALFHHCMSQAPFCDDLDALIDVARTFAEERFADAMGEPEIIKTAASAWKYESEGDNWAGRGRRIVSMTGELGLARDHPDAFSLLYMLRELHPPETEFALVSGMAVALGWTLRRWRAARDRLVSDGLIICTHPGGKGLGDPPQYRLHVRQC